MRRGPPFAMNSAHASFIGPSGTWAEILRMSKENRPARPALFLDRDGTIVEEVLYLHRPEEMILIPGAADTIIAANTKNIPVIIVTNQAGIGRGYYGWDDFTAVQACLMEELNGLGAQIDAVFACPYHASGQGPFIHPDHPDRKPNSGMLLKAEAELKIDLMRSWIAGDRASDVGAGCAARCAGGVHLRTGHGHSDEEASASLAYRSPAYAVADATSIANLTQIIPLLG